MSQRRKIETRDWKKQTSGNLNFKILLHITRKQKKSAFQRYIQLSDRLTLTQVTNFYVNKICCIAKEGLDPTRMEKDTLRMSTYLKLW